MTAAGDEVGRRWTKDEIENYVSPKDTELRDWVMPEGWPALCTFAGSKSWLPEGWVSARKQTDTGGTIGVFVGPPPECRICYHKPELEKLLGVVLGDEKGDKDSDPLSPANLEKPPRTTWPEWCPPDWTVGRRFQSNGIAKPCCFSPGGHSAWSKVQIEAALRKDEELMAGGGLAKESASPARGSKREASGDTVVKKEVKKEPKDDAQIPQPKTRNRKKSESEEDEFTKALMAEQGAVKDEPKSDSTKRGQKKKQPNSDDDFMAALQQLEGKNEDSVGVQEDTQVKTEAKTTDQTEVKTEASAPLKRDRDGEPRITHKMVDLSKIEYVPHPNPKWADPVPDEVGTRWAYPQVLEYQKEYEEKTKDESLPDWFPKKDKFRTDPNPVGWLPEGWHQVFKITSGGKEMKCWICPPETPGTEGKVFFHRIKVNEYLGYEPQDRGREIGTDLKKPYMERPDTWPDNVVVAASRVRWLPEGWEQGLKTTSSGRLQTCYMSPEPELKMYYHKSAIEKFLGLPVGGLVGPEETIEDHTESCPVISWPPELPKDWLIGRAFPPGAAEKATSGYMARLKAAQTIYFSPTDGKFYWSIYEMRLDRDGALETIEYSRARRAARRAGHMADFMEELEDAGGDPEKTAAIRDAKRRRTEGTLQAGDEELLAEADEKDALKQAEKEEKKRKRGAKKEAEGVEEDEETRARKAEKRAEKEKAKEQKKQEKQKAKEEAAVKKESAESNAAEKSEKVRGASSSDSSSSDSSDSDSDSEEAAGAAGEQTGQSGSQSDNSVAKKFYRQCHGMLVKLEVGSKQMDHKMAVVRQNLGAMISGVKPLQGMTKEQVQALLSKLEDQFAPKQEDMPETPPDLQAPATPPELGGAPEPPSNNGAAIAKGKVPKKGVLLTNLMRSKRRRPLQWIDMQPHVVYRKETHIDSMRHELEKLWYQNPGNFVNCDKCTQAVLQVQGRLCGEGGRSLFAQGTFLCSNCDEGEPGGPQPSWQG